MKTKYKIFFAALYMLFLFSQGVFAADAVTYTKKSYSSLLSLNQAAEDFARQLQTRAREIFDFDAFAQLCFVDIENKMSEAERVELTSVFSEVFFTNVFNSQSAIVKRQISKPSYQVTGNKGELVIVTISGWSDSGNISLGFYLKPQTEGGYKLADIDVEGVLLSRNYRGSFNRIFREQGFVGLYNKMAGKLNKPLT